MEAGKAADDRTDDVEHESDAETAAGEACDDRGSVGAVALIAPPTDAIAASQGATARTRKTRRVKPVIDLDDHIRKAQEAIKIARKQVQQARVQAKLEKRKKQRLVRKASTLNVEDLERIAVLKRCGLISAETSEAGSSTAPSSAASVDSVLSRDPEGRVTP